MKVYDVMLAKLGAHQCPSSFTPRSSTNKKCVNTMRSFLISYAVTSMIPGLVLVAVEVSKSQETVCETEAVILSHIESRNKE